MKELMFQNQTIRLIDKDGNKWASAAAFAWRLLMRRWLLGGDIYGLITPHGAS
ncbi:hypothetical protein [Alcaligenes faecalis]|uniref:hypothetical protein n=1 Tax=Alcaligenes faecalis TaxID=511 RepID=UPI0029337782|nr:hypothetical protein [Alcaligenes faecalis]MDV2115357.1 hypothetical protein [Alcaligenes faecalis]